MRIFTVLLTFLLLGCAKHHVAPKPKRPAPILIKGPVLRVRPEPPPRFFCQWGHLRKVEGHSIIEGDPHKVTTAEVEAEAIEFEHVEKRLMKCRRLKPQPKPGKAHLANEPKLPQSPPVPGVGSVKQTVL